MYKFPNVGCSPRYFGGFRAVEQRDKLASFNLQ